MGTTRLLPEAVLVAVTGIADNSAQPIVVDGHDGTVLRCNAVACSPDVVESPVAIFGLSQPGPGAVAVGEAGSILHHDGRAWVPRYEGLLTVQALWASAPDDVYSAGTLLGSGATPRVAHFDGVAWSSADLGPSSSVVTTLWGSGPRDVFAGALSGALLHNDGDRWSMMDSGVADDITAIWGLGPPMRRYNQRLYRTVRAIVSQADEAEDIVQQTYVTAYDKLTQFRAEASLGTWLTRIAINETLGRLRKGNRYHHLALVDAADEPALTSEADSAAPDADAHRRQIGRLLEQHIDRLPGGLRLVFMLRDVEELTTAETAASLQLSHEAVRTRLHRARQLMRERLSHCSCRTLTIPARA